MNTRHSCPATVSRAAPRLVVVGALMLATSAAQAQGEPPPTTILERPRVEPVTVERPLWEFGLGAGGLRLPHYRGSDQSHSWLLPVPYFVYRGEILKADRGGARAQLLERGDVEVDLSLAAGAPANSDDNDARRGMDDLAPSIEFGPNLNWTLARQGAWKLDLRVPLRAAFTIQRSPRSIGWVATPNLNVDRRLKGEWNLGLRAGLLFGDRRYFGYFYDVPAADATADRPAYRSAAGYGGTQVYAALSRRYERAWVAAFVGHDSVRGARFESSPLVRRRDTWSVGVAVSWVFATSSRQVAVDE